MLAGLLLAIACLLFLAWIAGEVLRGETQDFDNAVRAAVHAHSAPALTLLMQTASWLGSTWVLTVLGVGFAVWFAFAKWKRAISVFALTMAGASVILNSLKFSFRRPRPEPFFNTVLPNSYSFPSGHALFALAFFGILAWLISSRLKNRAAKIAVWALAVPIIFLIGFSRIYLGVHYPSDVIAGYAAAFVWVFAVALGDFWLKRRKENEKFLTHNAV